MQDHDRTALLVVDVQNDFCPGGALAVSGGDHVVAPLNTYIEDALARGWTIYASRDWHPKVTRHFRAYGGEWPIHCVQGTEGAQFHPGLRLPDSTIIVTKGEDPDRPGYSAFDGRTPDGTGLLADLRRRRIGHVYIGGLTTDYCVKHSALDALAAGLRVTVLGDAIAGVEVAPGDSERALAEVRARGADVTRPAA
jgi:nicotinamidase/pyrazinamidase